MGLTKENENPYRTATEVLMSQMEAFGKSDPKALLVIHTNEDGNIIVSANCGKCMALGMIRTVEHLILTEDL